MNKIKIGLLIPVFNGLPYTKQCLAQLYKIIPGKSGENDFKTEIVVIDDGSADGTTLWISENYPLAHILTGTGNLWWSGSINLGMQFALEQLQCTYVLWWNNDIIPADDYFNHLELLIRSSQPEIAGSKVYYADDRDRVWSMGGIFDAGTGRKYMTGMNKKDNPDLEQIHEADWLPGMGTLIHKNVIHKTGLLNAKDFPQYHGDSDYTLRISKAGYKILVFPQLRIWNDKSQSGLLHNNSIKTLLRSLRDTKSNYNLNKDLLFYRRHTTSIFAYRALATKYFLYIGGFIKWKLLSLSGIRKKQMTT